MPLEDKPLDEGSKITQEETKVESNANEELFAKQQKEIEELKKLVSQVATKNTEAPVGNNTAEIIEAVVTALKQKSDEEKYGDRGEGYTDLEDLDPDDVLEKGVAFFSHQGGYVIVDDKKNKRKVSTPFREPIVFSHYQTNITGSGRDLKQETTSRYVSHSKKEVDWLRDSSYYGWKIFDDFKVAQSVHAKLAQHINKFLQAAKSMSRESLFTACKQMDIQISTDIEGMRLQYATMLAEKALKEEEKAALKSARESRIEGAMLETTETSIG